MGEVLKGSNLILFTSNRISCQHQSYTSGSRDYEICSSMKTKKNSFGRHERIMTCISVNGFLCFAVEQWKKPQMKVLRRSSRVANSIVVPNTVGTVDIGLGFEEGEENAVVLLGKEELNKNSHEQELPPWGNSKVHIDFTFRYQDVSQNLTVSKGIVSMNEIRIHALEERDEEILSRRVLMLSRSNKVRSALELFKSMELSGLRPNVQACNSLLSSLLRNDRLDDALSFFDFMKTNEVTTGHTFSLILKAISDNQGCHAAIEMFARLESESKVNMGFDAVVYNTIISICGKVNNWVETERIWRSMTENGKIGTIVTYRVLVCTFVRCGQNDLAIEAYIEMIQNGLQPVEDAMQAVIGACAKEGKCGLALSVFQNMLNDGLKPNPIACNALINSLGKGGNVKLALRVYNLMKSMGHKPDAYTWTALLRALYRANRHLDALWLFERIKREQTSQLNLQLYNIVLLSCQRLGLWDRAIQLLWQMEASEMSVSTASYNLVIGACEVARKPKVALQVYKHMVHQKCSPDTFTYLSLIRSCIWGSLWAEVEEMLDEVGPNVSLYNAVVHGMCLRGKVESAKRLYMRMRESSLKPDGKTQALMLQNLSKDSFDNKSRRSS
ncbi:pentatricopeptide repeat-containing protein At3g29290 isoform X2 [Malania oleifera]|uniref:pentatricopeptide repeat-containing protein At3g29290 isoform X2 n=1 Tax=Malania oleifera TaxID=397392 RepID=UPI0025ADD28D|nr:pentatricopeptide repeat-containing protein At3g29290 isoform X2 [Malania oleifera]